MILESTLVLASLVVLAAIALLLAVSEFRRYQSQGLRAHLFWSAGLALVTVTLLEEAAFLAGWWSPVLIQSYLFLVAFLVGLLSLGSAEGALRGSARTVYTGFVGVASALVALTCLLEPASSAILNGGIVTGNPPRGIVLASTLLTVPAAALMAVGALVAARRERRWRLAWIAAGIIVISIAGALYIVSVPETLYYAEFVGVVLLYFGFGGIQPAHVARGIASPA